jgi:site-specific DNA recombinase
MTRAGLYARISEDQSGMRLGVDRQIADCQELIRRKGWTLSDTYVDNDVSATRDKPRPEYQRLLADMESGQIDAVVVWSLDRLHRRPAELEVFIGLAERKDIALGSVAGDHDLGTPDGRLFARMLGVVAASEAEKISQRVKRKQQQNREQGRPSQGGVRPYGYQPDRMTVIPHEAAIIRECAARVLAGESGRSIVDDLNRRRVQTVSQWLKKRQESKGLERATTASKWNIVSLRSILTRPGNAGLLVHEGEVVGQGAWEPILDRQTHDRLVAMYDQRKDSHRALARTRKYLLSGIARCGICDAPMQSGHGRGYVLYRCPSQKHGSRDMARIDEYVLCQWWEYRQELTHETERLIECLTATDTTGQQVQRLRDRLDVAAEQYADEAITAAQLTTITRRLKVRIEALERDRPSPVQVPLVLAQQSWEEFRAEFDAMTLSQRRFLIASEIVAVRIHRPLKMGRTFCTKSIEVEFPPLPSLPDIEQVPAHPPPGPDAI